MAQSSSCNVWLNLSIGCGYCLATLQKCWPHDQHIGLYLVVVTAGWQPHFSWCACYSEFVRPALSCVNLISAVGKRKKMLHSHLRFSSQLPWLRFATRHLSIWNCPAEVGEPGEAVLHTCISGMTACFLTAALTFDYCFMVWHEEHADFFLFFIFTICVCACVCGLW